MRTFTFKFSTESISLPSVSFAPLGFSLSEKYLKRSGVNYLENCHYFLYDDLNDFFTRCKGKYYFFTRYGKKPHSEIDFTDKSKNIYLIFGKESTGISYNTVS